MFVTKPSYHELHITFIPGDNYNPPDKLNNWKHSKIDGDANLGKGVKHYYTRQTSLHEHLVDMLVELRHLSDILTRNGCTVLRRKVEQVVYDEVRQQDRT